LLQIEVIGGVVADEFLKLCVVKDGIETVEAEYFLGRHEPEIEYLIWQISL
jgi:hypothetical protein